MASPTLEAWLPQAKEANPNVSEEALTEYFGNKYGPAPTSLPTLQSWLPQARKANPDTDETSLTEYWQSKYGAHGAKERESTQGDVARGFKDDFKQLPQLGYGLLAGAGAAAESVVGEGGLATGVKKFGVQGYQEKGKEIAAESKPTDSFSHSYDRAKEGDFGALVDWAQYSLGHAGAQGVQALSSMVLGGPAGGAIVAGGKAALGPLATTFIEKLVAKESSRLATSEAARGLAAEELTKLATANVAKKIGQTTALAMQATGMEGGEIMGDLAETSLEENRALSGEELAKGFGATLGAGALEFVGDKIGLDLILGKSKAASLAANIPGVTGKAARGTIAGVSGALAEGATEFAQTLVEEVGKGNDPFSDASIRQAIDASAMGAVGGASMGTAGGILSRVKPAPLALPPATNGPGTIDITGTPASIGVHQPEMGVDASIRAAWDLLNEDTAAQERNALAADRQAERALTGAPDVTIPRTGTDIPILQGADPVAPNTFPAPDRSRLWMDEAVTPGVQPVTTFTPRVETDDPRATIAAERAKIVAMKAGKPAVPAEPQSSDESVQLKPDAPLPSSLNQAYASVPELHELAKAKGMDPESAVFKEYTKMVTGKPHLDDLSPAERDKLAAKLGRVGTGKANVPAPPASNKDTAPASYAAPTQAATVPRSDLSPENSADMLLRAEKAQADIQLAPSKSEQSLIDFLKDKGGLQDQGGELSAMEVDGQRKAFTKKLIRADGLTLDQAAELAHESGYIGERDIALLLKSIGNETRDQGKRGTWYDQLTTGQKPLSRQAIEEAIAKIIQDDGVDTGKAVERVKSALLQDAEFNKTQWGEDADAIMRGDWPSWIHKPDGYVPPQVEKDKAKLQAMKGDAVTPEMREAMDAPLEISAHEAATSPKNERPEPTDGQKDAGNYKKGHVRISGLDISIENPEGATRSGTDANGKSWSIIMKSHYGYIRGTKGKDKEHIDIFVKPGTPDDYSGPVFVVDQVRPDTGAFDESKVMLGFNSPEDAKRGYLENYAEGWNGIGNITQATMPEFTFWARHGRTEGSYSKQPSKDWSKKGSGATRQEGSAGIRNLANDEAALSQPSQQTVSTVRGSGNNGLPAMANELPDVSGRRGDTAVSGFGVGSKGQQQGLRTGERPMGDPRSASEEQAEQSTNRVPGSNHADGGLGKGDGNTSDGPEKQNIGLSVEHREGTNDAIRSTTKDQKNADTQRRDETDGAVGQGFRDRLPQAQKQNSSQLDGRESASHVNLNAPKSRIVEASGKLAGFVSKALAGKQTIEESVFFEMADSYFGGTRADGAYAEKDAYDALELGVNEFILTRAGNAFSPKAATVESAREVFDALRKEILDRIPSQKTTRTEEQIEFQQFSTPPDLSFVMNWLARYKENDVMVEPSAGLGGLAVFAKSAGATVIVNEFSGRRAELLKTLPFDRVFAENAEQLNNVLPADVRPSVIVMNPPFSSTAGRKTGERKSTNGMVHLEQALKRLQDGGRLIALLGKPREAFGPSKSFEEIIKLMRMRYAMRARIGISGKGYKKYGTNYDNQILVFDKIKPDGTAPVTATVQDIRDAIPLLKEVRDARQYPHVDQSASPQPRSEALAEGNRGDRGREPAIPPAADVVGTDRGGPVSGRATAEGAIDGPGAEPAQPAQAEARATPDGRGGEQGRSGRESESVDPAERPGSDGRRDASSGRAGDGGERAADAGPDVPERVAVSSQVEAVSADDLKAEGENAVFDTYRPKKLTIKGAKAHPGKLVESAAMAAVDPPPATYSPAIPNAVIDSGKLSLAQLESTVYAGQSHEQFLPDEARRGFFVGDGTGVGKGREVAAIMLDNLKQGRKKAIWISKNDDLLSSASRDWSDLGQDPAALFGHDKVKATGAIDRKDGILFTTYNKLGSGLELTTIGGVKQKDGKPSRMQQIVDWVGKDFDGVIAFDEAHEMRNNVSMKGARGATKPAMKALAGVELQRLLPKARIVYFSATGGIEPSDFGYAERLGMWGAGTPFPDKRAFAAEVQKGGLATMEVFAQELKANGLYVARSLSFDDVTYDRAVHSLTDNQKDTYDEMAKAWQIVYTNISEALKETGADKNGTAKGQARGKFYGAQQRFFSQVLTSMQMPTVLARMKADLEDGNSVVIQLYNTNEAQQGRELERIQQEGGDLSEVDLSPKKLLLEYLDKGFPTQQFEERHDSDGNVVMVPVYDSEGRPVMNAEAEEAKQELLSKFGSPGFLVPDGALEQIINTFGPESVAEITGRKERVVRIRQDDGSVESVTQKRAPSLPMKEANEFMADKRQILVFSNAGSTGQSYHADNTKKNKRRRMHYVVQPGWMADIAMQGLGRTHRTNQASAPHYVLVSTDLNGHKRFISTIARRLAQLGALTRGQRQTSQGLFSEKDNLENSYARGALKQMILELRRGPVEGFTWTDVTDKLGFDRIIDKNGAINESNLPTIPQFLNRILSLEYEPQNKMFDAFTIRMEKAIEVAKANGTLETGLENYQAAEVALTKEQVVREDEQTKAQTRLLTFDTKHALDFHDFDSMRKREKFDAFYIGGKTGKIYAAFTGYQHTDDKGVVEEQVRVNEPEVGKVRFMSVKTLKANYRKVDTKEARKVWDEAIAKAPHFREEEVNLIAGSLLRIWDRLPNKNVRVLRVTDGTGKRHVGRMLTSEEIHPTLEKLGVKADRKQYTPGDLAAAIEDGATVELVNGWRISERQVSGEGRMELTGNDLFAFRNELRDMGFNIVNRDFKTRFFIPGSKKFDILANVVKHRPVLKIIRKRDGHESPGLVSNQVAIPQEKGPLGDPDPAEARTVEEAIEGKTALEAARFIADNAPSASHRAIAYEVARKIEEIEAAGMKFTFHVAHLNDRVPAALIGTRGLTWLPAGTDTTQVWVMGADVKGMVGTSHEVVLHELTHAATQASLYIGNKSTMADTPLGKSVKSLYDVTNAVIERFNARALAARQGRTTLTPFERAIFERRSNAIQDPGEILSWAFTNPEMQQYLESIAYKNGSVWTRFVEAIRTFLGLSPKHDTALSEVLRLGEELLRTDTNDVIHSFRSAWMPTQINQYSGLLNAQHSVATQADLPDLTTPPYVPATVDGPQQSIIAEQGSLSYHLPEMSKMDDVIRTMQDKNIDLARLVDTIKQAGNEVHDDLNPVLKEELYLGRVSKSTQDFLTDELRPLVDAMRLNSVTMEQLDSYLHARHAREANEKLAAINPEREDNDALSGMSNDEADTILNAADRPKMDRLAARVDSILEKTRRLLVDYGLESRETVNAWQEAYHSYVPLHREGYEEGTPGTGQGRSVRGPQAKARTGSTLNVTNILANVAMDREKAIVRGEKMRPVIALAALLQQYPNSDIATLTKPALITYTNPDTGLLEMVPGDTGEYRVPMVKGINRKTGMVEFRPDPTYKGRDNVVNFRLAGVDHAIVFNEHNERAVQMARALKDLDVGQLNTVLASVAPATRYLASINTQFNPVFGVVNFIRDIQFAMLSLGTTPLAGKRTEVRNATFKAIRGIYQDARAIRRGEHPTSPIAQLWERFQRVGGPTGYRDMFRGSNDRAKAIEHMLNPDWWQKTIGGKILTAGGRLAGIEQAILDKAAKPLFEWLSDYNQAMENAVRLGVFQVGLEHGMTDEQAASAAKNITVNFNKKGQITTQVGALYAFFNASVQGTARIAETLFEKGQFGVLSELGKKIVTGGVALGALQAFALSMAGFEDEEPPEWMKSRSLIIPVPGTDQGYVSIPMPLGFNILPNFGRLLAESFIHGKPIERAYQFLGTFVDAFSPVGGAATMSQFLAPTAVDPFVALSENKDWTGRKIYREDFNSLKPTPGMTRSKDTASPWAKGLAEAINWATGGTEYTPGHFSPTPDSIDYLVAQMTGGVGRETSKASQAISGLASGEEVPMHKIPLVGRLVGSASDSAARRNAFYDNLREVSMHGEEVEGRRLHREDAAGFLKEHPDARLSVYAGQVEREVQALNRRKRDMLRTDQSSERVRLIEMQIDRVMERFNERVKQMQAQ